jgi:hypothetical protein
MPPKKEEQKIIRKPLASVLPGIHITAIDGDYGETRQLGYVKYMAGNLGCTWHDQLDSNVTHLICTKEMYHRGDELMENAKARKGLYILPLGWLDSAREQFKKPRENHFVWNRVMQERKARSAERKKAIKPRIKKAGLCLDLVHVSCF